MTPPSQSQSDYIEQQLEGLKGGQATIIRRLDNMNGTVNDTLIEIGGVPGVGRDPHRKSLRVRLHEIETERATLAAATVALEAASQFRAASAATRFSRREKTLALIIAATVAAGPYIVLALHHL